MIQGLNTGAQQVVEINKKSALNIFKEKNPETIRIILAYRNPSTLIVFQILSQSGYVYFGNKLEKAQDHDKNSRFRNSYHYQINK